MAEIKLKKRIKYAGDVFKALVEKGWFPGDAIVARMTNGDRIRAMTDEEIICACVKLPICPPKTVSKCEFHCTSCWREYIQQPYKGDAE